VPDLEGPGVAGPVVGPPVRRDVPRGGRSVKYNVTGREHVVLNDIEEPSGTFHLREREPKFLLDRERRVIQHLDSEDHMLGTEADTGEICWRCEEGDITRQDENLGALS
jgi:hypothetical protein